MEILSFSKYFPFFLTCDLTLNRFGNSYLNVWHLSKSLINNIKKILKSWKITGKHFQIIPFVSCSNFLCPKVLLLMQNISFINLMNELRQFDLRILIFDLELEYQDYNQDMNSLYWTIKFYIGSDIIFKSFSFY